MSAISGLADRFEARRLARRLAWFAALCAILGATLTPRPAAAVISTLTPLRKIIATAELIFEAKIDSLDPSRPAMVLKVQDALKGTKPALKLPVNLTGDRDGAEERDKLLKRLARGLPIVVFTTHSGSRLQALVYTNGTWFQMVGA